MHETFAFVDLLDSGNAQAQLLLYAIARHADLDTGTCEVSQSVLARIGKCSVRTCRNYLCKLEADNLISRKPKSNKNGARLPDELTLVGYKEWVSTIRTGGVVQAPRTIKSYQQAANIADPPEENLASSPPANLAYGGTLKDQDNFSDPPANLSGSPGKQAAGYKDYTILDYTKLDCTAGKKKFGFQKYDLQHLETVLLETASPCLDDPVNCLGLINLATPQMWLESGADLYLDILPTLKSYAVKFRGKKIKTWNYFTDAVARCKAARDAGLPQVVPQKSENSYRPKTLSVNEAIDRAFESFEQEAKQ